jgi:hypothetical protein
MTATATRVLAPTATRAVTLITSRTPPPRILARATLLATPLRWDEDEQSVPSAIWRGGPPQHSTAGPLRAGELVIWPRQVSAGPDFAVAKVMGLHIGRIFVRELTVTCIGGLTAVQVDGSADGRRLHPGFRGRTGWYELEVAAGAHERNGTSTVTGQSIAAPGSALLRVAVVNVG